MQNVEHLVSNFRDLPTLPTTVLRVAQLVEYSGCSMSDIAKVLRTDPPLAAKVLRLANSSYYGVRQKVASLDQAVGLLGLTTLKNALLSASVFDTLRGNCDSAALTALWRHSVAVATAAKLTAKLLRYPSVEKAFTAGLLHDIGKILIARELPMARVLIVQVVREKRTTDYEAENLVLRATHSDLGAWALAKWNLPPSLVEAVGNHHTPSASTAHFDLTAICHIADVLGHLSGFGNPGSECVRTIDALILDHYRITDSDLKQLVAELSSTRPAMESYAQSVSAVG